MEENGRTYDAVVVGVSAGGLEALDQILPVLPAGFSVAILVVQHRAEDADDFLAQHFGSACQLQAKDVESKEPIAAATIYFAPAGYHLLVEEDRTLSLSTDPKVNYARPSIDVLFESAADVYGERLIAVILTGSSCDGSRGLQRVKAAGGTTIVQDPASAAAPYLPSSCLASTEVDYVARLEEIGALLIRLVSGCVSPQGGEEGD